MILQVGQILDQRYRVEKFIGSGNMGEVYKVRDSDDTAFALKLLTADLAEDLIFLRRFKREAQTLQQLTHPNIVRFYELVEADHLTFFLMDYVEGITLRNEIYQRRSPFAPERILEIYKPVCSALNFTHRRGVIHCDVKPANIMIEASGKVLLTDFGISRLAEAATTATSFGSAGTPAYMAPELVQGLSPRPATDVYSLGIILFELLSGGERPFTGEAAQITGSREEKVRWEQVNQPPPPIRPYNPQISPDVEQVLLRCLQKDPADRFSSTLELRRSLEMALSEGDQTAFEPPDQATSSLPSGPHEVLPEPVFHPLSSAASDALVYPKPPVDGEPHPPRPIPLLERPGLVKLAFFSIVLLIGLLLVLLLSRSGLFAPPATPTVRPTESQVAFSLVTPIDPTATSTITPRISTTTYTPRPSTPTSANLGKTYKRGLIAFDNGSEDNGQIFLHDPDAHQTWSLDGQPKNCLVPSFAWDGLTLLIRCDPTGMKQHQIYSIPTSGGRATQLTFEGNNMEGVYSPDGRRIAFVKQTEEFVKNIYLMDSSGRNVKAVTNDHFWNDDPQWSPDGQWLAFESTRSDKKCPGCCEIFYVNTDTFAQPTMVTASFGIENFTPAWSPDGQLLAFECRPDINITIHVCTIRRDGSNARLLTNGIGEGRPAWSPDGKEIVYVQDETTGSGTINILAVDSGHAPTKIQAGNNPTWSKSISP